MVRAKSKQRLRGPARKVVDDLLVRIAASTRSARAGKTTYLIGNNGTGKSRILGEIATRMRDVTPKRLVACIASSVHDRFTFGDHGNVRYLGARNASNAVFQAAVERQLCRFIVLAMLSDRGSFARLRDVTGMDLTFELGEESIEALDEATEPSRPERSRSRDLRERAIKRNLLDPRGLSVLRRIARGPGRFEKLREPQLKVLFRYLQVNIDISVNVRLADGASIRFTELSTGEQNRAILFAKVLSAMEEGAVFLIDEPEISLHLHWQMELHANLVKLLSGLRRYHMVIATHAPVIVSEAARFDASSEDNKVAVLRRVLDDEDNVNDQSPGGGTLTPQFHSFAEVASHEQLVLQYFQTAPYHTREVSVEIADTVLGVAENRKSNHDAVELLRELKATKGLLPLALEQIDAAIELIKGDLVKSIRVSAQ